MSNDIFNICKVFIDKEKFTATLIIESSDIPLIPLDKLNEFLQLNNIKYGIIDNILKDISENPLLYLNKPIVIAKGKEAINGIDAKIIWVYKDKMISNDTSTNKNRINFREFNQIISVKKGELVAKIIQPTLGTEGITVTGEIISAKPGRNIEFHLGKNVYANEEKTEVFANIDGQVLITDNNKINIIPVLEINNDLNLQIGNINFSGSVIINGNIPSGYKVIAEGDIKVNGNVEGSELFSKGDIYIRDGFIGNKIGKLIANGNIHLLYVLEGEVYTGKNLYVTQSILHSNVRAKEEVICDSGKGVIIGGKIQATKRVRAKVIGNNLATSTIIEVGVSPEIREKLSLIKQKIKSINLELDKAEKGILVLKQQYPNINILQEKRLLLEKLLTIYSQKKIELDTLLKSQTELNDELRNSKGEIEILQEIFPGVKIVITEEVFFIKDKYNYGKFILNEHEVDFIPF